MSEQLYKGQLFLRSYRMRRDTSLQNQVATISGLEFLRQQELVKIVGPKFLLSLASQGAADRTCPDTDAVFIVPAYTTVIGLGGRRSETTQH
jgi:hypothetical protein